MRIRSPRASGAPRRRATWETELHGELPPLRNTIEEVWESRVIASEHRIGMAADRRGHARIFSNVVCSSSLVWTSWSRFARSSATTSESPIAEVGTINAW